MNDGILYQNGVYSVRKARHGFNVYRDGVICAERCAIIGYAGSIGLRKAIAEADRRALLDAGRQ